MINGKHSVEYGLGVLANAFGFVAHMLGIHRAPRHGAGAGKNETLLHAVSWRR
jgi:hypothetical protein